MDNNIVSESSPPRRGNATSPSIGGKLIKKPICLCFVVMSFLLLLGIAALGFRLLLHKNPKATKNASFRVDSISVCPFKLSSSEITASWDIQFSVQNPSTASVLYQTFDTWIQYKQRQLTSATIAPFQVLGSNYWTAVNGTLIAKSVKVSEKVIKGMVDEMANGSVNFNIGLYAGYWIGDEEAQKMWWAVEAYCNDVKVGFSSKDKVGKLIGGPIQCILTKTW